MSEVRALLAAAEAAHQRGSSLNLFGVSPVARLVNGSDGSGMTALMKAAAQGEAGVLRVLLAHGAQPDQASDSEQP